jgi:hypothetical protein
MGEKGTLGDLTTPIVAAYTAASAVIAAGIGTLGTYLRMRNTRQVKEIDQTSKELTEVLKENANIRAYLISQLGDQDKRWEAKFKLQQSLFDLQIQKLRAEMQGEIDLKNRSIRNLENEIIELRAMLPTTLAPPTPPPAPAPTSTNTTTIIHTEGYSEG